MKKLLAISTIALMMGIGANAQLRIGAGFMGAAPAGDFGQTNSIALGAGVSGEYFLTSNFSLGAVLGYTKYSGKEEGVTTNPAVTIAPLMITANYHFMPGQTFDLYAGLGVGYGIGSLIPEQGDALNGNGIYPNARVGVNLMLSESFGIDANVGYSIFSPTFDGMDEASRLNNVPLNIGVFLVID